MAQRTYDENVELLADRMGLPYPVREDDLLISGVIFKLEDEPDIKLNDEQMDPGDRLFLQRYALREGVRAGSLYVEDMGTPASTYFAERWETEDRFATGMSTGVLVEIVWKAD